MTTMAETTSTKHTCNTLGKKAFLNVNNIIYVRSVYVIFTIYIILLFKINIKNCFKLIEFLISIYFFF